MITGLYHTIFYQPLYNALVLLTNILPFHDLGLAIVILTILVRFILFPFSHRSVVTQRKMKKIEPEVNKLKEKFKKNKEEQTRQIMALYREHGISPFSGFLMLLIQFPVFIALYMILRQGTEANQQFLYSFISFPQHINTVFLGLVDISKSSYVISFLAAASQFFQVKLSMPAVKKAVSGSGSFKDELQKSMGIQMKYIMPVLIFFIAQRFSSGMALYWTTSNIFAILHEIIVAKKSEKINEGKLQSNRNNTGGNNGDTGPADS